MSNVSKKDENINLEWLNNSILEMIISPEGDKNLKVTSYQVTRAAAAGDNYSSEMYRVSVLYNKRGQPEKISLVIKVIPEDGEMAKILDRAQTFTRENLAISSVIPNMYHLLEEVAPYQFQPFSPKCFYRNSSPDAIIMEDLKEKGFQMAKRTLGLDMNHSMLVIRKIATYHASSVVLHEKSPEIFQPFYEHSFNNTMRDTLDKFFAKGIKNFANEVESWPDYKDRFATKLHTLADTTTDLLIKTVKRDDNEFNVFRHGDLWINNMMFLYSHEAGNVEDVRFVDYQLCHFGDPATDIHYFLYTSVSTDLMDEHDKLLEEYYMTLKKTLTLLGYEHLAPSMAQLQKQLENKCKYAVIMCCTILPFVLADLKHIPDVEQLLKEDESTVHYSDSLKRAMEKYLPEFERKGWL